MPSNKPYVKSRLVWCKIAGVGSTDRCYLLRPRVEPERCHEHQRSSLHLPYQHDLPECVLCHQCKYLSHSLSAEDALAFWNAKIFELYLQFMNILSSRFSCSEDLNRSFFTVLNNRSVHKMLHSFSHLPWSTQTTEKFQTKFRQNVYFR